MKKMQRGAARVSTVWRVRQPVESLLHALVSRRLDFKAVEASKLEPCGHERMPVQRRGHHREQARPDGVVGVEEQDAFAGLRGSRC